MNPSIKDKAANIIGVLLGLLFIFSAWTKTFPIESFEYTIYSQLGLSKSLSSILARTMVGIEYGLGILLFLHFILKRKWVMVSSIILLIAFTIHLIILYSNVGNDVNCGCMGDVIKMAPLPSISKNVALLILLGLQYAWTNQKPKVPISNALLTLFLIAVTAFIFIAFPLKAQPTHLSYHKLYQTDQPEQPKVDLLQGKHVVSYMTLGCGHCRTAAKDFVGAKAKNPELPIYFILLQPKDTTGFEDSKQDFYQDTKSESIPHHFIKASTFIEMVDESGNIGTPVILWMKDSSIVREIPNGSLDVADLKVWLQTK